MRQAAKKRKLTELETTAIFGLVIIATIKLHLFNMGLLPAALAIIGILYLCIVAARQLKQ